MSEEESGESGNPQPDEYVTDPPDPPPKSPLKTQEPDSPSSPLTNGDTEEEDVCVKRELQDYSDEDQAAPKTARIRSTRSQNPEFAARQRSFMQKVAQATNGTTEEDTDFQPSPVTKPVGSAGRRRSAGHGGSPGPKRRRSLRASGADGVAGSNHNNDDLDHNLIAFMAQQNLTLARPLSPDVPSCSSNDFLGCVDHPHAPESRLPESPPSSSGGNNGVPATNNGNGSVTPTPPAVHNDSYCWVCHKEGNVICCETCPRVFHLKCTQLDTTPPDDWVCSECVRITNAENLDTRSNAMRQLTVEQLCHLLKFACNRMKTVAGAEPFCRPVNALEFPRYREFVTLPMDVTQLERNIKRRQYGSTEAFLADAKWILHNCIIFNTFQSKLTAIAKSLLKVCRHEMAEIETCPDCYLHAHVKKDSWFLEPCRRPHMLVWAKLKGFPFWPAKAMKTNREASAVDVRFFGAHDRAWVPVKDCFLYSLEIPVQVKNKKKGNLEGCIQEVESHIRKLQDRFGRFQHATFRVQFDPAREEEQLRELLPNYNPPDMGTSNPKKSSSVSVKAKEKKRKRKSESREERTEERAEEKADEKVKEKAEERREEREEEEAAQAPPAAAVVAPAPSEVTERTSNEDEEEKEEKEEEVLSPLKADEIKKEVEEEEGDAADPVMPDGTELKSVKVVVERLAVDREEEKGDASGEAEEEDGEEGERDETEKDLREEEKKAVEGGAEEEEEEKEEEKMDTSESSKEDEAEQSKCEGAEENKEEKQASVEGEKEVPKEGKGEEEEKSAAKEAAPAAAGEEEKEKEEELLSGLQLDPSITVTLVKGGAAGVTTPSSRTAASSPSSSSSSTSSTSSSSSSTTSSSSASPSVTQQRPVPVVAPKTLQLSSDITLTLVEGGTVGRASIKRRRTSPPDPAPTPTPTQVPSATPNPGTPPPIPKEQTMVVSLDPQDIIAGALDTDEDESPGGPTQGPVLPRARKSLPRAPQPPVPGTKPMVVIPAYTALPLRPPQQQVRAPVRPPMPGQGPAQGPPRLPQLQPRPPPLGLAHAGRPPAPSEAGPASAQLNKYSQKLADFMRSSLEEMFRELSASGSPEATAKALQLELERMQWRHHQEMAELKHNADLVLMELRGSMEAEKQRAMQELRRQCEAEKQRAVQEAKRKQWCAHCGNEALFYCCWNTSYCDYPCQQAHWPQHMSSCAQQAGPEDADKDGGAGGGKGGRGGGDAAGGPQAKRGTPPIGQPGVPMQMLPGQNPGGRSNTGAANSTSAMDALSRLAASMPSLASPQQQPQQQPRMAMVATQQQQQHMHRSMQQQQQRMRTPGPMMHFVPRGMQPPPPHFFIRPCAPFDGMG